MLYTCLRADHVLSVTYLDTFLTLKICDGPVFDFSVIQHDNADYCEILFLTQFDDNCTYILYMLFLIKD